jgi:hypothetical protein
MVGQQDATAAEDFASSDQAPDRRHSRACADRLALLLPNTPWHPVAFFGALRAGLTLVHLSRVGCITHAGAQAGRQRCARSGGARRGTSCDGPCITRLVADILA